MTQLYLISHGEAMTRVNGIANDRGLSPNGIKQAEQLRERLYETGEIQADVLISSACPRARQTAEIIAPALKLPILLDDDVESDAEGMLADPIQARHTLNEYEDEPLRAIEPGAGNWERFLRTGSALERIAREHVGKTVVIVCHGEIVDCSFLYFMGFGFLRMPGITFHTHNTSITHWEKCKRNQKAVWRLVRYNDDGHLRDRQLSVRDHSNQFSF